MFGKEANTQIEIHELIASRWSPRAFVADKPVPAADLIALFEAARWAPSCFNDQPWRFIVCNKHHDLASWQNALSVLNEKNQLWAKQAPVLIMAVAMTNFAHNDKPNRWGGYDTGAAVLNMSLQANALGLIIHQMGGYDVESAKKNFQLPESCIPMAMLAVGYQADPAELATDFQHAETATRSRAPLSERFYVGRWGNALD